MSATITHINDHRRDRSFHHGVERLRTISRQPPPTMAELMRQERPLPPTEAEELLEMFGASVNGYEMFREPRLGKVIPMKRRGGR